MCVCPRGGVPGPGGLWSGGVPGPGVWSGRGGLVWEGGSGMGGGGLVWGVPDEDQVIERLWITVVYWRTDPGGAWRWGIAFTLAQCTAVTVALIGLYAY